MSFVWERNGCLVPKSTKVRKMYTKKRRTLQEYGKVYVSLLTLERM